MPYAASRKLLVAAWPVLTDHEADRFAEATNVACLFFAFAYKVGIKHPPDGQSARSSRAINWIACRSARQ